MQNAECIMQNKRKHLSPIITEERCFFNLISHHYAFCIVHSALTNKVDSAVSHAEGEALAGGGHVQVDAVALDGAAAVLGSGQAVDVLAIVGDDKHLGAVGDQLGIHGDGAPVDGGAGGGDHVTALVGVGVGGSLDLHGALSEPASFPPRNGSYTYLFSLHLQIQDYLCSFSFPITYNRCYILYSLEQSEPCNHIIHTDTVMGTVRRIRFLSASI